MHRVAGSIGRGSLFDQRLRRIRPEPGLGSVCGLRIEARDTSAVVAAEDSRAFLFLNLLDVLVVQALVPAASASCRRMVEISRASFNRRTGFRT